MAISERCTCHKVSNSVCHFNIHQTEVWVFRLITASDETAKVIGCILRNILIGVVTNLQSHFDCVTVNKTELRDHEPVGEFIHRFAAFAPVHLSAVVSKVFRRVVDFDLFSGLLLPVFFLSLWPIHENHNANNEDDYGEDRPAYGLLLTAFLVLFSALFRSEVCAAFLFFPLAFLHLALFLLSLRHFLFDVLAGFNVFLYFPLTEAHGITCFGSGLCFYRIPGV